MQGAAQPGQGAPGYPGQGAPYPGQGAAYPGQGGGQGGGWMPPQAQAAAKGFFASLFDISFTSFVTPKIIKILYVLMMILLGLVALGYIVFAFSVNAILGLLVLIIIAPLMFFIYLALWRIALEIIMVIFKVSEDVRAIRDRGSI